MNLNKIVLTGGGSGGHAMPCLSLYDYFSGEEQIEFVYIGSFDGIELKLAKEKNISYKPIYTGKLRRYFSWKNFFDIFRVIAGFFQSIFLLFKIKPTAIFATGGFVCVPVCFAGWILRIPVYLYETTIRAGLANRLVAPFAKKIFLAFEESGKFFNKNKIIYTGIVLRPEFKKIDENKTASIFNENNRKIIYVTGGANGSKLINSILKEILPELLKKYFVFHQCGKSFEEDFSSFKSNLDSSLGKFYCVKSFFSTNECCEIFCNKPLLIGRSGIGTVGECLSLNIPAVFIPLKIAQANEQFHNAELIKRSGGAIIISEDELNEKILLETINSILENDEVYSEMKENINKLQKIDGIKKIASHFGKPFAEEET